MTILILSIHMWFTIPPVSPAAWNKLNWNIINSKYNTLQEGLHEYSIPGSVQLETTQKNVTPTTLWGRRQAKKHRTHRLSLLEPSNTGNIMAWEYQRLEFNFQHGSMVALILVTITSKRRSIYQRNRVTFPVMKANCPSQQR
jgi:hypothetical protein